MPSAHPVEGQYALIVEQVRTDANELVQKGAILGGAELRTFVLAECQQRFKAMLLGAGVRRTEVRRFCNAIVVDAPNLSQCDVVLPKYPQARSAIESSGIVG